MSTHVTNDRGVVINADVEWLGEARKEFSAFLGMYPVAHEEVMAWELAFTEVVSNAIFHGSEGREKGQVRIAWEARGDCIWLWVSDTGSGPRAEVIERPVLPEDPLASSGRGMFIISQFIDQWMHTKGAGGYTQVLVKKHQFKNQTPDLVIA